MSSSFVSGQVKVTQNSDKMSLHMTEILFTKMQTCLVEIIEDSLVVERNS